MSIRENFFAEKLTASLWDVAVSMKRGNPLPLDVYSVFDSYSALESYINPGEGKKTLSYPGQIVAVVGEDSTSIYYLDQNLDIQPVGIIPSGDNKTIEVTTEGAISLLGAKDAANGTIPMIDSETGKMVWKTLEDIGAGDGNDNTTYEFNFAEEKITVTPKFNGIAQDAIELDLSSFVTAEELSAELEKLVDNDTTYSIAEDEKVLKLNDTVFSTEIGLKHENGMISLTGIDGEVIAEFSDADFVKDSVLEDVEYDSESKEIVFTWKTIDGETKSDAVSVADFVQTYVAGNGLELTSNEFAIKVNSESESFLSVDVNGLKVAGIQEAINSAANTAKSEAIADAATKYATTGALSQLETDLDARLDAVEAYDHSVYATKEELTPISTAANNAQTAVSNLETRFDEIVAVGGEPNAINKIQVNGSELTIENKTVNIPVPTSIVGMDGYSALDERITAAKNQADLGVTNAGAAKTLADENKANLETLDLSLQLLDGKVTTNISDITTLKSKDEAHDAQFKSLNELVTKNGADIVTLTAGKVDKSTYETDLARIVANEQAIATIKSTYATNALIGEVEAGKTVVQMIEEAKTSATYNDSEIRASITTNSENINKNTTNIATLTKKVDNIANVVDFKGVLEEIPTDNTGYENGDVIIVETEEYVFNGTEWVNYGNASAAGAQITALSKDIAAINTKIGEVPEGQSLMSIINNLADGTSIIEKDGKLSVNEVSTDLLVPGTETLYLYGGSSVAE